MRYKPKERRIFKWHDGQKNRASDPLAVERGLVRELGPNWLNLYRVIKSYNDSANAMGDNEEAIGLIADLQEKAFYCIEQLTGAARKVFKVEAATIDEAGEVSGMTEPELLELLAAFTMYMNELEEQSRPLPISPSATEHSAANYDTGSLSDSTLIASE